MCGITGFNWSDVYLVKRMNKSIMHRGPDEEGYFVDKNVTLGSRRLRIIDLNTGKQPIKNEDGSIWIVYNGEVYNHKFLREELEQKGHRFYTSSDTEVIVHAYEEFSEECVNHLNGMFAFAIWDSKKKMLFLARDRLGIKPLYFYYYKGNFLFASEIKSLLQFVSPELNINALINYMTFRYSALYETFFKGIYELPPGHILIFKENKLDVKRYWDLRYNPNDKTFDQHKEQIKNLLKTSVQDRLMSDVPFGAYLSGGMDSSIVVGLMSDVLEDPVKTFSVGFEADEPINELKSAKILADYYNTDHHELVVKSDSVYLLPEMIWHLDQPISDPTIIPQYLISEYSKKYVTMVLTGEGADELFCGYSEFKFMKLSQNLRLIPKTIRGIIPKAITLTPNSVLDKAFEFTSSLGEKGFERFENFINTLDNRGKSYLSIISFFSDEEKKELYNEYISNIEKNFNFSSELNTYLTNGELLTNLMLYDIKKRLPYFLLHKIDKMSMANAIEARVPFLDYRLVEYSFTIPSKYKLKGMKEKFILRETMKNILPKDIVKKKKHPFVVPFDSWFKENIKELAEAIIDNSKLCNGQLFNRAYVDKIINDYYKSPIYYGRQLWSILTFDVWYKIYIENKEFKRPKLKIDKLYN